MQTSLVSQFSPSMDYKQSSALTVSYQHIELPLTRLHYATVGEGPPLIIVPATASMLADWIDLTRFMGQAFTAHFFELPGHGESSAFPQAFHSDLVAETIEHFVDAMGYDTFTLMGFSFGGILTMKTLHRLEARIERVVMIAPCLTQRALMFSQRRKSIFRYLAKGLSHPAAANSFGRLAHHQRLVGPLAALLRHAGQLEDTISIEEVLMNTHQSTFEVLAFQLQEILNIDFSGPRQRFSLPCYFAHSLFDPLLEFDATLQAAENIFSDLTVVPLYFPYHQPPSPPTVEELNRDFGHFLNIVQSNT